MENKIHDMGRSEFSYHNNNNNKRSNNNNETVALQNANEKLLSQVQAHKQAVEGHKKANEEAHEEVWYVIFASFNNCLAQWRGGPKFSLTLEPRSWKVVIQWERRKKLWK